MKFGTWFSISIALVGLGIMFFVFLGESSPYVTLKEAKKLTNSHLHVAGDVVPGTLFHDIQTKQLKFQIRDTAQEVAQVVYDGAIPSNLASVTKVVAIGSFQKDVFQAHQLLVKCPSKYESTDTKLTLNNTP